MFHFPDQVPTDMLLRLWILSEPLAHYFLNGGNDTFRTRNVELFQWWTEWYRRMRRRDQFDGRIKFGEGFICRQCSNVSSGTTARVVLVHNYEAVRFGH